MNVVPGKYRLGCILETAGNVYKALNTISNKHVAIKLISLHDEDALLAFNNETAIMELVRSAHIVSLIESFVVDEEGWIVMEYCEKGNLQQISNKMREESEHNRIEEGVLKSWLRMIVEGVATMHRAGVVHRDIKASNVLCMSDGTCKLADFGSSAHFSHGLTAPAGTPHWMAPEICVCAGLEYNEKVDIWSLGITAIELATGSPPLASLHELDALTIIPASDPPTLPAKMEYSSAFEEFIKSCLCKEPAERLSATQLLQLPFFNGVVGRTETQDLSTEGKLAECLESVRQLLNANGRTLALLKSRSDLKLSTSSHLTLVRKILQNVKDV